MEDNVTFVEEKGLSRVASRLTLNNMAAVNALRCEAHNEGGIRARDIRLVSNCECRGRGWELNNIGLFGLLVEKGLEQCLLNIDYK